MRCAVLDDDKAQTELVVKLLADAGHGCEVFHQGRTLINRLRQDTFDLLIVDWNMPGMSGIEVLETVRQGQHANLPILMITSRADDEDVVTGLAAGADDYIVKPLNTVVFMARVDAALRRAQLNKPQKMAAAWGAYSFDVPTETVTVHGEPVKLTAKELALAMMLFENMSRPLSRSYLLESIWGQSPEAETRTLDAHVSRIRSKLNLRAENGFRVLPVYSYGYRLEPTNVAHSAEPIEDAA
ncbi:response regulator transcription factor [Sandaracinobacter sp.]|jgi:DNA-binding response OmpR family regulator|uniref:response regulator transcription factor n=1 Tax=Sandaracinobacter sp. TaxID=2487581 RepID=UPI0035B09591